MEYKSIPGKPQYPPVSERQIVALEEAIGVKLPGDYRNWLLECNGFDFEDKMVCDFHPTVEEGIERDYVDIQELYYLSDRSPDFGGLLDRQDAYDFARRFKRKYFLIGGGWRQSHVCIGLFGDHYGRVYYHQGVPSEDDSGVASEDELRLVADTFKEFWNSLVAK